MSRKHQRVLEAIFAEPTRANLAWDDVVSALVSQGVEVRPLGGSLHALAFGGTRHVVHKPHPGGELKKPGVRAIRRFCVAAGIGS